MGTALSGNEFSILWILLCTMGTCLSTSALVGLIAGVFRRNPWRAGYYTMFISMLLFGIFFAVGNEPLLVAILGILDGLWVLALIVIGEGLQYTFKRQEEAFEREQVFKQSIDLVADFDILMSRSGDLRECATEDSDKSIQ